MHDHTHARSPQFLPLCITHDLRPRGITRHGIISPMKRKVQPSAVSQESMKPKLDLYQCPPSEGAACQLPLPAVPLCPEVFLPQVLVLSPQNIVAPPRVKQRLQDSVWITSQWRFTANCNYGLTDQLTTQGTCKHKVQLPRHLRRAECLAKEQRPVVHQ